MQMMWVSITLHSLRRVPAAAPARAALTAACACFGHSFSTREKVDWNLECCGEISILKNSSRERMQLGPLQPLGQKDITIWPGGILDPSGHIVMSFWHDVGKTFGTCAGAKGFAWIFDWNIRRLLGSSYILGTLGRNQSVKFSMKLLQWCRWGPKMQVMSAEIHDHFPQDMQRGMECDLGVWRLWKNQLSWPASAWKRRELQDILPVLQSFVNRFQLDWKLLTRLCNTGRLSEIDKELRRDLPSLLSVQQGEQGFAYQMLFIEQGKCNAREKMIGGKGSSPRMQSSPPEWHSIFRRQGIPISTCTCRLKIGRARSQTITPNEIYSYFKLPHLKILKAIWDGSLMFLFRWNKSR